eukprot:3840816-Karenia_brevis.AAC.1
MLPYYSSQHILTVTRSSVCPIPFGAHDPPSEAAGFWPVIQIVVIRGRVSLAAARGAMDKNSARMP